MTTERRRLTLTQTLAFASIGVPLAAVGLPMAVFIAPFYADQMGLGAAMTGLIFMCLRFWDLATDPIMGWLVDTRPSRWGRVRHWLASAVPILALAAFFLYMPGQPPISPLYVVFWLTVFYVGITMLYTPHQAWVPTIASDYDDRSRMFMWREIVSTATLLSLLALPTILSQTLGFDRHQQIAVMGIILIVSLPLTVGLALRFVPDPAPQPDHPTSDFSPQAIRKAFRNSALWRVLAVEIFVGIAIAGTAGMFLFTAEWVFGVVDLAPVILMAHFVAGFAAMPVWTWFSKRTEKHLALRAVCLWSAATYLLYIPLASIGGFWPLMTAALISGFGYGAPFILVRSMMADVIEREAARSGEARSGLYYSMLSGAYKTGASFAIGIPYLLLGLLVGFVPGSENDAGVVRGLLITFVAVPLVAYTAAGLIAGRYPLTRAAQAEFNSSS